MSAARVASAYVWNVGIVAVKIELPSGPRWLQSRELHVLPLDAHFERMFPVDLGEVVVELDRRTHFIRGQERVAAQRLQSVNAKCRETAIFLLLWNALDSKLPREVAEIGSLGNVARRMQIIQPCAGVIDRRWRNDMVPNQRALLGQRCLVTLVEPASVGNASKDRRNELRIVHIAESVEHLVFLREIDIQACVEGFSVLTKNRRIGVVRGQGVARGIRVKIEQFDSVRVQAPQWNNV